MTPSLDIIPVSRPVAGCIRPPGSKSLTNRALILAALAQGQTRLTGVLDSVDTQVMIASLRKLGWVIEQDLAAKTIAVAGCGGRPASPGADLWLENSGTSIRFLTALCCLGHGRFRLDGNARMRERPIQPLVRPALKYGSDCSSALASLTSSFGFAFAGGNSLPLAGSI